MKHIKTFESFGSVKLVVKFHNEEEYYKAVEFFDSKSIYSPEDFNQEFKSITFQCTDQDDADATEKEINSELLENNFNNYYFEQE